MLEQWFRTVAIKLRLDSVTLLISFILQKTSGHNAQMIKVVSGFVAIFQ